MLCYHILRVFINTTTKIKMLFFGKYQKLVGKLISENEFSYCSFIIQLKAIMLTYRNI